MAVQAAQLVVVWLEDLQVAAFTKRLVTTLKGCRCNQQLSYPWLVLFGELGQAVIWDGMGQYAGILSRPSSVLDECSGTLRGQRGL
ncbi:hypothetical protein AO272_23695 [Pseudomonas syringae pv. cerasicola]|nr:hypothetical protein AO272_23695 [Pseudomonas syringae pv. cerasicola]